MSGKDNSTSVVVRIVLDGKTVSNMANKPPLGVIPCWRWNEIRREQLSEALQRHAQAEPFYRHHNPNLNESRWGYIVAWSEELAELEAEYERLRGYGNRF